MMGLAETSWFNLGPQERNLILVIVTHCLFNILYNSMLVGLVLFKNEWCCVDRSSELGLCLVHGTTALVWFEGAVLETASF